MDGPSPGPRRARGGDRRRRGERRVRPVPTLLRLSWRADRFGFCALAGASVFEAAATIGGTVAIGLLLNAILRDEGLTGTTTTAILVAVGVIFLVQRVAFPFLGPAVESLEHRLTLLVRERVMLPLLRPASVIHLEDPKVADEVRQAELVGSENFSAQQSLGALNDLVAARLTAVASGVLLSRWRWWAPLVLAAVWLVSRLWYRLQMATLVASMEGSTPALRQAEYVGDIVLDGTAAKETRIFNAAGYLVGRFADRWLAGMTEVWRMRRTGRLATIFSASVLFGSHLLVLGLLVRSALAYEVDLGYLFIYLQAALGLAGLGFQAENEYMLRMGAVPLPHVVAVDRAVREWEEILPAGELDPQGRPGAEIRLEGVSFTYPRTDREVIHDLDLTIPAGRSLAIVGENGAGKSTIVNLICGFYPPTRGRVTVDGVDLAELDQAAWQRRIAAVFQDFVKYPVTIRENITFGCVTRANDFDARQRAAERAGITELVESLPRSWYTLLSREWAGGTDLSGGQWQRVALARALFALEGGAGVLVLDEPTAHLDVRAEAALYNRFFELTRGLTTIVVSHRFSTVRQADRIVVLDAGRVAESGTHDELLALGGRYARMFGLQARYYTDETQPVGAQIRNGRRRGAGNASRSPRRVS